MTESTLSYLFILLDIIGMIVCWSYVAYHEEDSSNEERSLLPRIFCNFFILSGILDYSNAMFNGHFNPVVQHILNSGMSSDFFAMKIAIIVPMIGIVVRNRSETIQDKVLKIIDK